MGISNLIAAAALFLSIISFFQSNKSNKAAKEWEIHKENVRKNEVDEQIFHSKNNSRISVIPSFHLSFNEKIFIKNIANEENFILPISLINLGRESATNIGLEPMTQNRGLEDYFKTERLRENIHFIHEYLDKQYAFPGETVKFSACCKKHDKAHDVFFKIKFSDLVGRTYEQEFRFQYCYEITKKFSMNHISSLPVCIEDDDKTGNSFSIN